MDRSSMRNGIQNNNNKMLILQKTSHKATLVRLQRREKHSHLLCTFLVLFVGLFLVMTTMYVLEKRKQLKQAEQTNLVISEDPVSTNKPEITTSFPTKRPRSPSVCKSMDCILTITDLLNSIDPRKNPCQDFYEYACGGWMKKHKILKGYPFVDEWVLSQKRVTDFLKEFLINKELQSHYSNVTAVVKAVSFYEACISLPENDPTKGKTLIDLIHKFIPWPMIDPKWNETKFKLEVLLAKLSREINVNPFIDSSVRTDMKNSSQFLIHIGQSFEFGLFLGQFRYNSSFSMKGRKAYKELIHKMAVFLGAKNDTQTSKYVEDIYKVEFDIANAATGYKVVQNEEKYYNKMTIGELIKQTEINWLAYFNELLSKTHYRVDLETQIIVSDLPGIKKIIKILKSLRKRTLLNYLGWRIIRNENLYQYTSKEAYKMREKFRRGAFSAITFDWKRECRDLLQKFFPMALARVFVDKHFHGDGKKLAEDIAASISAGFQETLRNSEWMDFKTKAAAIEKVKNVWGNYGYPEYILDDNELNQDYKLIKVYKDSIFKTIISTISAKRMEELEQIQRRDDKTRWLKDPLGFSPSYLPTSNAMNFPAAFLQPPLYDQRNLRAVSYGGVGAIIGHELMHAFDTLGKSYDKDGNYKNWWTNVTLALYENKTKCFVNQYNSFMYKGIPVNGEMSLSENIADVIGVEEAYKAYHRFIHTNGGETRLPGTIFTNDQVFFLSYARNWCRLSHPEQAIFEANTIYAPSPFRVNGPLKNLPAFSKAFNCPVGSFMNPKKKCSMW